MKVKYALFRFKGVEVIFQDDGEMMQFVVDSAKECMAEIPEDERETEVLTKYVILTTLADMVLKMPNEEKDGKSYMSGFIKEQLDGNKEYGIKWDDFFSDWTLGIAMLRMIKHKDFVASDKFGIFQALM